MKHFYRLAWLTFLSCSNVWAQADFSVGDPSPTAVEVELSSQVGAGVPVVILFDRSASMKQDLDGSPRIDLARDALDAWSATLAGRRNVAVRFFAGGSDELNEALNCEASELLIPLGHKIDTPDMTALSKAVRAIGRKTNIAYALKQAQTDLAGKATGKIILISDGLENCQGDPEQMARELASSGVQIDVLAIGEARDVAGLGKIALASGGQFSMASNASQFSQQMQQQLPGFDIPDIPSAGGSPGAMNSPLLSIIEASGAPAVQPAPAIEPMVLDSTRVSEDQHGRIAIELILDASGSMWGRINDETKISIARKALAETLGGLDNPVFMVGLRAYGFDSTVAKTAEASCPNTELLSPIQAGNLREIRALAQSLTPYGYTPITQSLSLAGDDLSAVQADNRMIVLITDGKETCDGDPVATAQKLCQMGVDLETHIVGFDLDPEMKAQMKRVAEVGCGTYSDARDAKELTQALNAIVEGAQSKIDPTWLRTIYPIEGGSSPETAVPLNAGTYTLKRSLPKGEQMYFRVNTQLAQHGLLRGLIQSARLVRQGAEMVESEIGLAQFTLTLYPPNDSKGRGRKMRLAGEPGSYKHIGYLDTVGEGFVFSIGSNYDSVHPDSLFNVDIREAGDLYEGIEAPPKEEVTTPVVLPLERDSIAHLGEGDFADTYQLPLQARRGSITAADTQYAFSVSIYSADGQRLSRKRARGQLNFEIPEGAAGGDLLIEDKNPALKQVFTAYEISLSSK